MWKENSYKQTPKPTAYQLNWNEGVLPQNIASVSSPIIVILVINSFPRVLFVQYLAATKSFMNMYQQPFLESENIQMCGRGYFQTLDMYLSGVPTSEDAVETFSEMIQNHWGFLDERSLYYLIFRSIRLSLHIWV